MISAALGGEIATMERQVTACFRGHPDAVIYLSQPGTGEILGARQLGEFGDDPHRYASAKARKDYARLGSGCMTMTVGRCMASKAGNDTSLPPVRAVVRELLRGGVPMLPLWESPLGPIRSGRYIGPAVARRFTSPDQAPC